MSLITSQGQFNIILGAGVTIRDGLYVNFSTYGYCGAQDNYTMEFEYYIYSNSSDIDGAVLRCGVDIGVYAQSSGFIHHECWGQSIGIINLFVSMCDPGFTSDGNLCIGMLYRAL